VPKCSDTLTREALLRVRLKRWNFLVSLISQHVSATFAGATIVDSISLTSLKALGLNNFGIPNFKTSSLSGWSDSIATFSASVLHAGPDLLVDEDSLPLLELCHVLMRLLDAFDHNS